MSPYGWGETVKNKEELIMRINHNISAMNAQRQLTINQSGNSKALQKLSSGLKINSAADDAAGLAISERMRAQIRGLDQAERNAQDGISLIQTAEGALQETTELVQRMRELAVQATSDIMTSTDREAIETEMNQLKAEINRSANTIAYNGKKLFTGEMAANETKLENVTVANATASDTNAKVTIDETMVDKAGTYTLALTADGTNAKLTISDGAGFSKDIEIASTAADVADVDMSGFANVEIAELGMKLDLSGVTAAADLGSVTIGTEEVERQVVKPSYEVKTDNLPENVKMTIGDNASVVGELTIGRAISEDGKNYVLTISDGTNTYYSDKSLGEIANPGKPTAAEQAAAYAKQLNEVANTDGSETGVVRFEELDITIDFSAAADDVTTDSMNDIKFSAWKNPSSARIHVGANADDEGIDLTIADMTTGPNGLDMTDSSISVSTAINARNTLSKLDEVLTKINTERANLGAMQNRIESTVNNLALSSENLTSAESRIRDVDMAEQMVEYSKYNILNQAAMSMLAQANSQPNMVMNLLQGL